MATYTQILKLLEDVVGPALYELSEELEDNPDNNYYKFNVGNDGPQTDPRRPIRAAKSISIYDGMTHIQTVSIFCPDSDILRCGDLGTIGSFDALDPDNITTETVKAAVRKHLDVS